ncbi:MFS transporter [Geminicoccus roseus]|uniref:MFS transporter n=1 Tax=Geminicoccus roseus TaxID=404900 RepID=UPI00042044DC|nr:MFS transporter [Geminicoccus roseus]
MGPYTAVIAVVIGAALLQFANALFAILLPVRLTLAEASPVVVGLIGTAYGTGFLFGCALGPHLVRRVGHIRAFAALAAACALVAMAFAATLSPWLWTLLRFLMGVVLAGLFVIVEAWLAAATPKDARGGVIAFYLVTIKAAVVLAQTSFALGVPTAPVWIGLAVAGFIAALIPVTLTRTSEPPMPTEFGFRLAELWRTAPAAVVGVMGAGLINGAVPALLPVWGDQIGIGVSLPVILLSAMQAGSLLVQWPLGRLSDRIDRRWVIVACLAGVAGFSGILAAFPPTGQPALLVLFLLLGGVALSFYGICAAHAADQVQPGGMTRLASGMLFIWAVGAASGPLIAAKLMEITGPSGLFLFCGGVTGGVAGFVLWRMTRRAAVPPEERPGFVNLPATSPSIGQIDPRAR